MKKTWQGIVKVYRFLEKALNWVEMNFLIVFTSFIGVAIMVEIVLRIFGIQGSKSIEEISRMMLVTTTFVGSSLAVKTKGHVAMTALVDLFPPKIGNVFEILSNLICGGGFLFLAYSAAKWTASLAKVGRTMDSASFPLWPFWVVIAFSFLTTGVRFLLEIVKVIKNMKAGVRVVADLKEM